MALKGLWVFLLSFRLCLLYHPCLCESIRSAPQESIDLSSDLQSIDIISMNGDIDFYSYNQGYQYTRNVACDPCRCVYFNDSYFAAYCDSPKISDVPEKLPDTITHLYISNSSIRALDLSRILKFTRLTGLFVTRNLQLALITGNIPTNSKRSLVELDLADNAIREIQSKSLRHMNVLRKLNLSVNKIEKLYNKTFYGANYLQCLNLSNNALQFVESGTFDDLIHLLLLDMSFNKKLSCFLGSTSSRFSQNLKQLQYLDVHKSNVDLAKCKAIAQLTNLRTLRANAFNDVLFYPEMRMLTFFSTLYFDSVCKLEIINESLFENTPFLKVVELKSCKITHIDRNAFRNLQHLKSFTIERGSEQYNITKGLSDMQGLQNINLTYLALRYLSSSIYSIFYLDVVHAKYLSTLPLETLDLTGNNIAKISVEFLKLLPKTLKRLVLNENSFYSNEQFLQLFKPLSNIISISLSQQGCLDFYCKIQTLSDTNSENCENTKKNKELTKHNTNYATEIETGPLILPTNLKSIYASYNSVIASAIFCQPLEAPSLVKVDFSHGYLPGLPKCHLPHNVKIADLSYNFCNQLNDGFIASDSSIEYLNIRNNFLGHAFMNQASKIFNQQKQLKHLDISNNYIYALPAMFFTGLTNLDFLNASHNKLEILELHFSGLNNLTHIDFSDNLIVEIGHKTRRDLEQIASSHPVFLDLGNNPLMCTCYGLELIVWLATTVVDVSSSRHLICKTDAGKDQQIFDLKKTAKELQSQCTSKSTLFMILVSSLAFLCLITIISFAYKYRWRLRYLKSVALMKMLSTTNYVQLPDSYKFDAYILYAEETRHFVLNDCIQELEIKRGHRLCIEERDFLPGTYIVTNIVSAIQNSAKTLAIITPDFYLGYYTEYGMKMSIMTEIFEKRSLLHLLIKEPTAEEDLSHDILTVLKSNKFTEFPPEQEANDEMMEQFWSQISQIIRKTHIL